MHVRFARNCALALVLACAAAPAGASNIAPNAFACAVSRNCSGASDCSIASGNRPAQVASWGSVAGGFGASDAVANVR